MPGNLTPMRVTTWFHPDNKKFDATLLVTNNGDEPAGGEFEITFGYSYYDYSQDPPLMVYRERQENTPLSMNVQPGGTYPYVFPDIPYVRKPGVTTAPYTFFALVDSDGAIAESDEYDNDLTQMSTLRPPRVARPRRPNNRVIR
jgi:hypothetical protein